MATVSRTIPGRDTSVSGGSRALQLPWPAWITGGFAAGVALLCVAYSLAASDPENHRYFTVFWAGIAAFLLPVTIFLLRSAPSREQRLFLLVLVGVFLGLPKFLRSPLQPLYADELAHARQTEIASQDGRLFIDNPFVGVVDSFPGLHGVSLALRDLTGLSVGQLAAVLVFTFLVLDLLGVFLLTERLVGSARAGSVAALIYGANSGFMFFDSQYAYESMGIPLLIWTLVAAGGIADYATPPAARRRWFVFACLLGLVLVITHHLTTIALLLYLIALGIAIVVAAARESPWSVPLWPVLSMIFMIAAAAVLWAVFVATDLTAYLLPHLGKTAGDVGGIVAGATGNAQSTGRRELFQASITPPYERWAAFVAPVLTALAAFVGVIALKARTTVSPLLVALAGVGVLYFPSVPLILTSGGAEGARRTWAFTFVGLAVLVAAGVEWTLRRDRLRRSRAAIVVLAVAYVVIQIGNVAAGQSVEYRFPGAPVYGSDTRALTPEIRAGVRWFTTTQGTRKRIVTDRSGTLAFSLVGLHWTEKAWSGLPLWNFYFLPQRPDRRTFQILEDAHTRYLVVDRRMYSSLPVTGVYLVRNEPGGKEHLAPPPRAALDRLDAVPWLAKIYESDTISIYRIVFKGLAICSDQPLERGLPAGTCEGIS